MQAEESYFEKSKFLRFSAAEWSYDGIRSLLRHYPNSEKTDSLGRVQPSRIELIFSPFGVIVMFLASLAFILWFPEWGVNQNLSQRGGAQPEAEAYVKLVNESRTTAVQLVGGLALLIGLYFTKRNLQLTEHGKNTDRYVKAIEMLSQSPVGGQKVNSVLRLGAVYSLAALARDSHILYWPAMDALSGLMRLKNGWKEIPSKTDDKVHPPPYIQAALEAVIFRRKASEKFRYDLSGAKLIGAFGLRRMWNSSSEFANFRRCYLWSSDLTGAHLEGANFKNANCYSCNFSDADLSQANFVEVDDVRYANFTDANLGGANFCGVNLADSVGLLTEQLAKAKGDANTCLPNDVPRPLNWCSSY